MAEWFTAEGVTDIAMEATGSYWKPVWYVLEERLFELKLVNAQHVKILPGRKSDVLDAQWLAELLEHGLLRDSFVPPRAIRELRDLTRYRKRLIQAHTAEGQRIAKTLEDAGIKLGSVASEVLGVSSGAMLAALVAGERDPGVLADLAKGKLRNKVPALRQALRGRFGDHHAMLIGLGLDHIAHLEGAIARLDERIDAVFAAHTGEAGVPFTRARDRYRHGPLSHRRAPGLLGRVCPGNNITGGKRGSGKTTHGDVWLLDILTQCAWAAARTRDTYLSAQFWRLPAASAGRRPPSPSATPSWSSAGTC
jgi:transposase